MAGQKDSLQTDGSSCLPLVCLFYLLVQRQILTLVPDAFGRVMYSYKDLAELAGYTARVSELLETMQDIRAGKFQKALVSTATTGENASSKHSHISGERYLTPA